MTKLTYHKGFSLLELSVVLMVIGVVLGMGLTIATNVTTAEKRRGTEASILTVEQALAQFVMSRRRLPCPADGSLPLSDADYGVEMTGTGPGGCDRAVAFDNNRSLVGVVPVRTLGLSDAMMRDAWNRRITYAVHPNFTRATGANSFVDSPGVTNATYLNIRDDENGTILTRNAIYVLLSHGMNGYGAYAGAGGNRSPSNIGNISNAEAENAEFSRDFVKRTFTSGTAEIVFDDVITYGTKTDLSEKAGAIEDPQLCAAAIELDNIATASTTLCFNERNNNYDDDCIDLAREASRFCFNTNIDNEGGVF